MSAKDEGVSGNLEAMLALAADRDEPLHRDLVPYIEEGGPFGSMIRHPLVYDLFMGMPGTTNRQYLQKKRLLAEAEAEGDWHQVISLHERPYRLAALIDTVLGRGEDGVPFSVATLADPEMRDLVAWVWCDSENIHEHIEDWLAITEGHVPGEPLLMGDQPAFDALPLDGQGRVEVWRGDCDDGGWSWTTERKVAEFFCARWGDNHDLLHGFVDPRYVFGYITNRSETEVMVRREHVTDLTRTKYPEEG